MQQGAPRRPCGLFPQQLLPDRQHMAALRQQPVVPHLAGDLGEVEAMAEVADLQIGVLEPLRLLQGQHSRQHALIEDAHVIGPAGERFWFAAGMGQHQVLGDELDVHHAAGDCLRSNSPAPALSR